MIIDNSNSLILVTGVQRSGASIIAKIIDMCGAFTGRTSEMMENDFVKDFVGVYYDSMKIDRKAQFPLPDTKEMMIPVNWKKQIYIRLNLEMIKIAENQSWMFKSSTNCQIWPIWNYAFPNAKWIIVRRRTGDIISSCMKTAYMDAFKDKINQKLVGANSEQEGWLWWVHEHEKLFVEMIEAGLNCKIIWPERMVNGDYSQIFEMLEWLGLKWDDSIINTIDPMLWNSNQKKGTKLCQ
jgi:hypothetical protein